MLEVHGTRGPELPKKTAPDNDTDAMTIKRVTLVVPRGLDDALERLAKVEGRLKMRLVSDALNWSLTEKREGTRHFPPSHGPLAYPRTDQTTRVTFLLPVSLDQKIESIAKHEGRLKMRVLAEAIAWYLHSEKGVPNPWKDPASEPRAVMQLERRGVS
jgi:predicted transcriptional regulator